MKTSPELKDLATALAKAQGEIRGAKEDSQNPHFKSSYADLASVWAACRAALSKNGLSVTQTMATEGENIVVETTLLHSSGQWISGSLPLLLSKQDMQGEGSAITYARRYSLAAIVGVAPDDDDAEGAMGRTVIRNVTIPPITAPSDIVHQATGVSAPTSIGAKAKPRKSKDECEHPEFRPSKKNTTDEYCAECWLTRPKAVGL